jgi:putative NIF3 family GTP cyclohydrolase 1 type 2
MDFGPRMVRTVAVVSGGAAMEVEEAGRDKVDVFITGEPVLAAWHMAREYGVNAIFGGHYATETFGVRALAELLSRRFKIKAEFIDLGIPY